jgi:hypothetical protein
MVETNQDVLLTLYVILVFVAFMAGFFLGAFFGPSRRKEPEPWHARLAAAEAKPRHDRKGRSTKLLAGVTALVVVFSVIVLDHFKGPLFPDVFYSSK